MEGEEREKQRNGWQGRDQRREKRLEEINKHICDLKVAVKSHIQIKDEYTNTNKS